MNGRLHTSEKTMKKSEKQIAKDGCETQSIVNCPNTGNATQTLHLTVSKESRKKKGQLLLAFSIFSL